jgi:hypothetical protein
LDFELARLNGNGGHDAGFGTGGKREVDYFAGDDLVRAVRIQGDVCIVVAGSVRSGSSGGTGLLRFNPSQIPCGLLNVFMRSCARTVTA